MDTQAYAKWKESFIRKAMGKRLPICGQFELTPRCNLDCKMCYIHNQDSNACKNRELSTQQWKDIFDQAYDNGLLFATLTGGECLIRPDFRELYLHLYNKRVLISVLTNGTTINRDYVEFFAAHKPEFIRISLYGSSEEAYERVTGHKGFAKTVQAIRMLQDAGIKVQVTVTPSSYMGDDYIEIVKFARENGFELVFSEMILVPNRDNPEKADHYLTEDQIVEFSVRRQELYRSVVPAEQVPEPFGPMDQEPGRGLTCSAGNALACVTWEGVMHPCINAMIGGTSLLEKTYAEAWEQVKAEADSVVQGVECKGCAYEKLCPKCPAMRLTSLHSGRCNTAVCAIAKRLAAAGVYKTDRQICI